MTTLSKKLFYAIEAVLYIAYNTGATPISSKEVAEKQGLSPRYLEQLMQKLVRGGVLRGVRGPHGGYVLARERRRISVGDICDVLADDAEDTPEASGTPLGHQVVLPMWAVAHRQLMVHLQQVSLAELCEQAHAKHIKKSREDKMDFTI